MNDVKLDIRHEDVFKMTPETPVEVFVSKEQFKNLTSKYGLYGFDWYFVDEKTIKYWDGEKWNYASFTPLRIKRLKEVI